MQPVVSVAVPDLIARYTSFLRDQEAQHLQNSNARPVPILFSCQDARIFLLSMLQYGHYASRVLTGAAIAVPEAFRCPNDYAYGFVANSALIIQYHGFATSAQVRLPIWNYRRASLLDVCKLCLRIFCHRVGSSSLKKTDKAKQNMGYGWNPVASCTIRPTNGGTLPAMCSPPCNVSQSDGEKQHAVWLRKSASHARAAAMHTSKEPENASELPWLTLRTNHTL